MQTPVVFLPPAKHDFLCHRKKCGTSSLFFASFEFQGRKLALIVASCGSLLIYFLMPLPRPKGRGTYNTYIQVSSIVSTHTLSATLYFRSLLFGNIFKIQILIKVASCRNFNLN